MADALGFAPDAEIRCRDFRIGCIGAGFIMADVHLAAYAEAGFPVVAIASRTPERVAEEAKAAGKVLSVNQNMRFDQSMRVLKQILERGSLGAPVIATIEMRAIPHWQPFLQQYDRLTLLNMSIHHLDVLRFLFGDPTEIYTAARTDPRTQFPHRDGITVSTLQF